MTSPISRLAGIMELQGAREAKQGTLPKGTPGIPQPRIPTMITFPGGGYAIPGGPGAPMTFGPTQPFGPGPVTPPGVSGPPTGAGTMGGLAGVGGAACNLVPPGVWRQICQAGAGFLPGGTGGAGGTTGTGSTGTLGSGPTCPQGTYRVGNRCVSPGDIFPGGAPFITGAGGVPVAGSFGMPGFQPMLVQQPIRRCPAGMALAKDGICYVRSLIPRKFRAHPPGKRPPLSGADAAALRRIGSLQTRVKRLAKSAGLSMTTRRGAPRKRSTRKR